MKAAPKPTAGPGEDLFRTPGNLGNYLNQFSEDDFGGGGGSGRSSMSDAARGWPQNPNPSSDSRGGQPADEPPFRPATRTTGQLPAGSPRGEAPDIPTRPPITTTVGPSPISGNMSRGSSTLGNTSQPGMPTYIPGVGENRNTAIDPESWSGVKPPDFTGRNKKGEATFLDPNITIGDRLKRGAQGFLGGPKWTDSKTKNRVINAGIGATPLRAANAAFGLGTGLASKEPVNRVWKGGTFDPSMSQGPEGYYGPPEGSYRDTNPNGSYADISYESEGGVPGGYRDTNPNGSYADISYESDGAPRTAGGAEEDALRQALGGSPMEPSFRTETVGQMPRGRGDEDPSGFEGGGPWNPTYIPPEVSGADLFGDDPRVTYPEDPRRGQPRVTPIVDRNGDPSVGRGPAPPRMPELPPEEGGYQGPISDTQTGMPPRRNPGTPGVPGGPLAPTGPGPLAPPAGTPGVRPPGIEQGFIDNPIEGRPKTPEQEAAEKEAVAAVTGAGSGGGGYSYAGFDFGQDPANRDITKSAKYAFSHFAGQAGAKGIPQPTNKDEAQAWFEQNIAPGLTANGFQVHKVVGDKAFISTRENPGGEWIDFQGNSGGQGDQPLTWQSEGPQDINSDPEGTNDASYEALNQILTGDGSGMDTSAMKNRLKEQRLQMAKDERGASQQGAAARGMLDSGYQASQERRINQGANKDILGGFRDVDIASAQEGTKNKLAATEALESVLSGRTTRADVGFENTQAGKEADFDKGLEGAKFKEGQDQFGAEFGLNKANAQLGAGMSLEGLKQGGAASELAKWGAGTDAQLKGQEQDLAVAQGKTNELLGRMGLAVNLEDIAQRSDRDKKQFLVDMFRTLVQNEQHNSQLGLGYSQLGQSMNEMMANMAKSIGM